MDAARSRRIVASRSTSPSRDDCYSLSSHSQAPSRRRRRPGPPAHHSAHRLARPAAVFDGDEQLHERIEASWEELPKPPPGPSATNCWPDSDDSYGEHQSCVAAPPSVVFEAFTDPAKLARWWGPAASPFRASTSTRVPAAATASRCSRPRAMLSTSSASSARSTRPARLAFTFVWEPPDPGRRRDARGAVVPRPRRVDGDGVQPGRVQDRAAAQLHRDGWSDTFDRLEQFLARQASRLEFEC